MVTVSYNDDTYRYHITGHRSLSRTVMIPSGIIYHSASGPSWMVTVSYSDDTYGYHITGYKQLVPVSASKVYAGMKHKTNDKYMHMMIKVHDMI